jgi:hypothetical protein
VSQSLDLEALEALVAEDPGAEAFGTLAESYRRVGRLDDARRVAVAGLAVRPDDARGRLALGLTLLDLGEAAAARYELERAMGVVAGDELADPVPERDADVTMAGSLSSDPPLGDAAVPENAAPIEGVADEELDAAFEGASALRDEMVDANRIAEQAMRAGQLDEPEGFDLESSSSFATETMARLLDAQGDHHGAQAIRERLGRTGQRAPLDAAEVPAEAGAGRAVSGGVNGSRRTPQSRALATLESWLANLQRSR